MADFVEIPKKVNALSPGETLARQVFDNAKRVLFQAGHCLSQEHIAQLKKYNIDTVYVILSSKPSTEPDKQKTTQTYDFIGIDDKEVFDFTEGCLKVDSQKVASVHTGIVNFTNQVLESVISGDDFKMSEVKENIDLLFDNIQQNKNAMISLVHLKDVDNYTFMHSVNVSVLAMLLAERIGLSPDKIHTLGEGAILHDIGKMDVDQEILNKPGKLSDIEFSEMKNHAKKGYMILKKRGIDENISLIALTHHEKLDGSGYPLGISSDKIPVVSRVAAIVDIYDALTAERVYKKGMHPKETFDILTKEAVSKLDSQLLSAFKGVMGIYPISSKVLLANGSLARIIKQNHEDPNRPVVEILSDRYGNAPKKPLVVNTLSSTEYIIARIYKD